MTAIRNWLQRASFVVCGIIGLAGIAGCGSAPVAAPTDFADYNSPGGTFACQYPADWQADGGGARGLEWAKFTSGPAEVRLEAGVAGSLVAGSGPVQTGQFGFSNEEPSPELEPIHGLHVLGKKSAEEKYNGYKEVGEVEVTDVPLGPARRSEFTASTTFGSGLHGYRATALGHDKAVYVFCVCPESDWKTLQPAFDKMLLSMRRGEAER